jgi:hypothetical protein
MVNVSIACDNDDVGRVPAARQHIFSGNRKESHSSSFVLDLFLSEKTFCKKFSPCPFQKLSNVVRRGCFCENVLYRDKVRGELVFYENLAVGFAWMRRNLKKASRGGRHLAA